MNLPAVEGLLNFFLKTIINITIIFNGIYNVFKCKHVLTLGYASRTQLIYHHKTIFIATAFIIKIKYNAKIQQKKLKLREKF